MPFLEKIDYLDKVALKKALLKLKPKGFPLYELTEQGGFVDENDLDIAILAIQNKSDFIEVKFSIFFTEIIVGCGCGDDPFNSPVAGELLAQIDNKTGEISFA